LISEKAAATVILLVSLYDRFNKLNQALRIVNDEAKGEEGEGEVEGLCNRSYRTMNKTGSLDQLQFEPTTFQKRVVIQIK
jgi:hypothetical protein